MSTSTPIFTATYYDKPHFLTLQFTLYIVQWVVSAVQFSSAMIIDIWVIVRLPFTNTNTKKRIQWLKDPTYAISLKIKGCKDIKYEILTSPLLVGQYFVPFAPFAAPSPLQEPLESEHDVLQCYQCNTHSPKQKTQQLKQACKLGRCYSYLWNLKLSITLSNTAIASKNSHVWEDQARSPCKTSIEKGYLLSGIASFFLTTSLKVFVALFLLAPTGVLIVIVC